MDEGTAGAKGHKVDLIRIHPLLGGVICPPAEPVLCTLFTVQVYTIHCTLSPGSAAPLS